MDASAPFGDISTRERDMLVRYCTRFTGDAFVAEDLAQQTLLEAWAHGPLPLLWAPGPPANQHTRIRRIPRRADGLSPLRSGEQVETGGVPVIVAGFESMTGQATIEGLFARDTFERIDVHVTPGS